MLKVFGLRFYKSVSLEPVDEYEVDTMHVRYWSEVLCYTIMTYLGDFEVKVTDFEILCLSF